MGVLISIDIGGTFTDTIALDSESGKFVFTKVPSTPGDFSEGFFRGFDKILDMASASREDILRVVHGTTVSTNSIVQWNGAKIGILTTCGFRDILIMGREWRADFFNLQIEPETPTFLCPRQRMLEIRERIDSRGNVLTPLNEDDVVKAVNYLVQEHGVEAIAVCYLFSFLKPVHEERTKQIIHKLYPNIRVSISSKVNPRFREYERMVITAFDSYIGPEIERYIGRLNEGLAERHIDVVLQVIQSRGGVTSGVMCVEKPVVTVLSGPAAGVVGGSFIGAISGRKDLITLDMGGTSCDVSLIRDGQPSLFIEGTIDKYPLRQAMVDLNTIGAGGGSIAWVDTAGGIRVGPHSAGASPGPACYGWGGEEPTVTDASIVLGYLNPDYFAGGGLALKPELAREAIQKRVAAPLGMDLVKAASGIHQIVNNNMADQLRIVSIGKGYHPQAFSLVAFGGGGPVVAGRLMQLLNLKEVIIPISPGVLSALGLLAADIEHEEIMSFPARVDEIDLKDIAEILRRLWEACEQKREGVGISQTRLCVRSSAEMRYVGQGFELEVPFPDESALVPTTDTIQEVTQRFHDAHQRIYQHSRPDTPVEFMAFRMVFSQEPYPKFTIPKLSAGKTASPKGWRYAYFDEYEDFVNIPLYERAVLVPRQRIKGPVIVEQKDTTTIVYPNQEIMVDDWGNLVMSSC
ncbi:hydantoinase/oxoprolinase family protein [Chloroflexota bacterium]